MRSRVMIGVAGGLLVTAAATGLRLMESRSSAATIVPAGRAAHQAVTSRDGLASTAAVLRARIAARPDDEAAATGLADALMRQARVTGDAALPVEAEHVVRRTIRETDGYLARRMLGAVLLAQHRFAEALAAARSAAALRPDDPWNHGVLGDAALELGDYDAAFATFDRMAALKPNAASYARIAYARELQGDLEGAIRGMRMAIEATSPHDPEALAWHWSQVGALEAAGGRVDRAEVAYRRALHAFPGHRYARTGRARLLEAQGRLEEAFHEFRALHDEGPSPELAAAIGDIHKRWGASAEALRMWTEAERLEREGWEHEAPQPAALARMLAERDLKIDEAVRLARQASGTRDDIHTNDALAWALFKSGDLDGAWAASQRARRTGTRDPGILSHAAAIEEARRRR